MRSLRLRLLAWLLPPMVVVAAVAAGGAYMFLERRLNAAYDHDLGDVARALVPYIRDDNGRLYIDFTPQAEAVLRADSVDQVYYAVFDANGKQVGSGMVGGPPVSLKPGVYHVVVLSDPQVEFDAVVEAEKPLVLTLPAQQ